MNKSIIGRVHSFQSLGTVDGPGVRFVVFTQGCNLRCSCCHNPDTWDLWGGTEYSSDEIIQKTIRYKEYFGTEGGITVSGGEPLLQASFVTSIFELAHKNGINTCLDTSGSILNDNVKVLLEHTDRTLLDIKYTNDVQYKKHVGCSIDAPLSFLEYVNRLRIPTTIRQVIIPTLNDTDDSVLKLKELVSEYACVDKIELLHFRKICQVKYDNMHIEFPFSKIDEPKREIIEHLQKLL